jgi:hypothetical protein
MKQLFRSFAISTGVVVLTFMLFAGAIQTAQAQTCSTPTIDMKLLVVSNGKTEADFAAIKQILDYLGTPYDVFDMSVSTGGITAAMLSDGSCHGYYQGVIFAFGGYIYTLPGMATLTAYEQTFGIRQLNWYMYPNNDFGFNYPYSGTIPDTGTDSASYTTAGASAFFYANSSTPVTISNAFIYLGTPLSGTALPAGASVTPLLTDPSGYALSLIYTHADGRQYLTQTFDSNQYLTHDLVLAYGLINWVTKGIFLGEYHVFAAAQVDDFFINDSEWIPGTPCTDPITHDRTAPDSTTLPFFRINYADMSSLVAWQNKIQSDGLLSNFKLTLAFNGVGTTGNTDWTGLPKAGVANDDLTTNVQKYQQYFHWISHTYDHPNSLNGLHKSDPYGDPDTPQMDSIDLEILTNQYVANGSGQNLDPDSSDTVSPINLTDFNPANVVTPGVTGLNDPNVPSYLVEDGVQYAVTDTSVLGQPNNGPNPSPNVGIVNSYAPGLYEVPRRPNDVFFNAANWNDDQAEFACIYAAQPPYNTWNGAQILDYVSSSFVTNMLMGDMDPEMFHQPDLHNYDGQGHSLISDTYDQTFTKYEQLYRLPVLSPTLDQLGQSMQNRNNYNLSNVTASLTGAPGSNVTISITIPASSSVQSAIIPVTGLYTATAETYGGQYISHVVVNNGQTDVLPVPPQPAPAPLPTVSSLTFNPTSVTGGAQSSTGTVTLSGPAPAGGSQVPLSSNNTAASVPPSVTVPAGASSATFTPTTMPVSASTPVTITASYGGASASGTLTLVPPTPVALAFSPSSVTGATGSPTGTVTLNGPAPSGGALVSLTSNNAAASVPSGVRVPAGATSASFNLTTTAVATSTLVSISASYGGGSVTASFTVLAPVPSALAISPSSVTGATSSPTGVVTLNGPAPAGGAQVVLSSNSAAASVPANGVTVPAGATTASFTLTTSAVATSTTVTISASFGGGTQTATLTVLPPIVSSLTLNPTSVIGGPLGASTGTVTLNGPAPAGGAHVLLSSNNAAASVPSSVTVPAGATTATFTVTTNVVVLSTTATISASYNSTTKSANLTVTL